MRRMAEDEHPLMMCLSWADVGAENLDYNKFVLQENDCGEIMVGDYDMMMIVMMLLMMVIMIVISCVQDVMVIILLTYYYYYYNNYVGFEL